MGGTSTSTPLSRYSVQVLAKALSAALARHNAHPIMKFVLPTTSSVVVLSIEAPWRKDIMGVSSLILTENMSSSLGPETGRESARKLAAPPPFRSPLVTISRSIFATTRDIISRNTAVHCIFFNFCPRKIRLDTAATTTLTLLSKGLLIINRNQSAREERGATMFLAFSRKDREFLIYNICAMREFGRAYHRAGLFTRIGQSDP